MKTAQAKLHYITSLSLVLEYISMEELRFCISTNPLISLSSLTQWQGAGRERLIKHLCITYLRVDLGNGIYCDLNVYRYNTLPTKVFFQIVKHLCQLVWVISSVKRTEDQRVHVGKDSKQFNSPADTKDKTRKSTCKIYFVVSILINDICCKCRRSHYNEGTYELCMTGGQVNKVCQDR